MSKNTAIRLAFFVLAVACGGRAARRVYIDRLFDTEPEKVIAHILPGSAAHAAKTSYVNSFTLPDGRVFNNSQGGYSGKPGERILVEYVRSRPE